MGPTNVDNIMTTNAMLPRVPQNGSSPLSVLPEAIFDPVRSVHVVQQAVEVPNVNERLLLRVSEGANSVLRTVPDHLLVRIEERVDLLETFDNRCVVDVVVLGGWVLNEALQHTVDVVQTLRSELCCA